jgi:xanthine dehydrogenase accessory factor
MAVNANKEMEGSIGGGIMEHKFVEMAKEKLQEIRNKKQEIRNEEGDAEIRKQIHDKAPGKNQSGMICSGEQTILIYRVQEKDISQIEQIIVTVEQNKNGMLHLSPEGILFDDALPAKDFEFDLKSEENWNYTEQIGYKNHLNIIGGGHCALAFSKLMWMMDFYIHLFEDRHRLNTMEVNKYVHEKTVVNDYSELAQLIPSGQNNYVVIMTFGYRTDDIAIRTLLNKDFKYFGLLGSKKKIEKMFTDYKKEGIDESFLKKIHSPIGIQIKSETPEEIAVSIAAEIIKLKNQG